MSILDNRKLRMEIAQQLRLKSRELRKSYWYARQNSYSPVEALRHINWKQGYPAKENQ